MQLIFQQNVVHKKVLQNLAENERYNNKSSEIFQEELYQIPTTFQASVESPDHCKRCEKYKKTLWYMIKLFLNIYFFK